MDTNDIETTAGLITDGPPPKAPIAGLSFMTKLHNLRETRLTYRRCVDHPTVDAESLGKTGNAYQDALVAALEGIKGRLVADLMAASIYDDGIEANLDEFWSMLCENAK